MKYPLSILLIGISYLTACSSSPDSHFPRYSDFPKTKALSAQVINLDTILFRYPFRVAVRDSIAVVMDLHNICLLYTSPSPRDISGSRMPSSA